MSTFFDRHLVQPMMLTRDANTGRVKHIQTGPHDSVEVRKLLAEILADVIGTGEQSGEQTGDVGRQSEHSWGLQADVRFRPRCGSTKLRASKNPARSV